MFASVTLFVSFTASVVNAFGLIHSYHWVPMAMTPYCAVARWVRTVTPGPSAAQRDVRGPEVDAGIADPEIAGGQLDHLVRGAGIERRLDRCRVIRRRSERAILQMVVRLGIPPTEFRPGFHAVNRSAEMSALVTSTVTVAVSLFDGSATLVATTWYVPAAAGAVYWPDESTVPPRTSCTDQVTRRRLPRHRSVDRRGEGSAAVVTRSRPWGDRSPRSRGRDRHGRGVLSSRRRPRWWRPGGRSPAVRRRGVMAGRVYGAAAPAPARTR